MPLTSANARTTSEMLTYVDKGVRAILSGPDPLTQTAEAIDILIHTLKAVRENIQKMEAA